MHTDQSKNIVNKTVVQQQKAQHASKPNEQGNLYVASHIKIHDPETKQVFVSQRG